jgi:hypothetical protein
MTCEAHATIHLTRVSLSFSSAHSPSSSEVLVPTSILLAEVAGMNNQSALQTQQLP